MKSLLRLSSLMIVLLCCSCASRTTFINPTVGPNEVLVNRWSPDHVWLPAHYVFKDGKHVRVKGRFEYKPSYKSRWVAAHLRKTPRGKVWIDDRWE